MKDRVIIIGGGVAGLTAAHELIERGFEVHLYERRGYFGGKAASTFGAGGYPGEHGFRFFPSWYRHLPDTLGRIPYRGRQQFRDAKTVLDNLIPLDEELITWFDREPLRLLTHLPRSVSQARAAGNAFARLQSLGLAPGEMAFFAHKMTEFLITPDAQREAWWEGVTWWNYLDADNKSQAYRDLIGATTRLMVAAKAQDASAYSIGRLALRTFSDALTTVDRVLNGPTSVMWIDPWVDHLKGLGVQFHPYHELDSVQFTEPNGDDASRSSIAAAAFSSVTIEYVRRVEELLPILCPCLTLTRDPQDDAAEVARSQAADGKEALRSLRRLLPAILDDPYWKEHLRSSMALDANARGKDEAFEAVSALLEGLRAILPLLDRIGAHSSGAGLDAREMATIEAAFQPLARLVVPSPSGSPLGPNRRLLTAVEQAWSAVVHPSPPLHAPGHDLRHGHARSPSPLQNLAELTTAVAVRILRSLGTSPFARPDMAKADYYVFALPVEQMAYYVNRSTAMTELDGSLRNLLLLSECTDWMAGIQFYLREPFDASRGHIVCMDSNWSLTAIEQTQFWRDTPLVKPGPPGTVTADEPRAIISVDISEWDRKGRYVPLEAYNCSANEIAKEVWSELKASVNSRGAHARLRDDMLIGGKLTAGVSFHLDDSIAEVYDRKKQAAYERARGAKFDAVERARETGRNPAADMPYVWGAARELNAEPLLVNSVGSRALRPAATTAIVNMFLAADYVRTDTDLACMEGANEAARLAVNAILDASASLHERCRLWSLSPARDVAERLGRLALRGGGQGVTSWAAHAAGHVTDALMSVAGQAISNWRGTRDGNGNR